MKRQGLALALVVILVVILCGCAREDEPSTPTQFCSECGDEVDRWIKSSYGGFVCARCFGEENCSICRGCGLAYSQDEFDCCDGYCTGCAETEAWSCSVCEERFALDHLADLKNGYYLCAACACGYLIDADPGIGKEIESLSPFVPREVSVKSQ